MASTLKIDNTALLDLGTRDIIQGDVQYKKKNTLQYLGLLSNMTKKEGSKSILSTTGKEIKVEDNTIKIDDQSFAFAGPYARVNDYVEDNNIIAAGASQYLTIDKKLVGYVKTTGSTCTLVAFDADNPDVKYKTVVNETIGSAAVAGINNNLFFVIKVESEVWGYVYCFSLADKRWTKSRISIGITGDGAKKSSGDITIGLPSWNTMWIAYDGHDVYSRVARCWDITNTFISGSSAEDERFDFGYFPSSYTHQIVGFGCIDPNGKLLTGEPVVMAVNWTRESKRSGLAKNWRGFYCTGDFRFDGRLIVDSINSYANFVNASYTNGNYFDVETLANGVIQIQRDTPKNVPYFFTYDLKSDGTEAREQKQSTNTLLKQLASLGATKSDYTTGRQSGSDLWPSTSMADWKPRTANWTNFGTYCMQLYYVYSINTSTFDQRYTVNVLPAQVCRGISGLYKSNGQEVQFYNQSDTSRSAYNSLENWTQIGFNDIYNPLGLAGSENIQPGTGNDDKGESQNGVQLFPHLRFFYNRVSDKGITYDYGPGWCKFLYTTMYVRNMSNYGFCILEEPAQLVQQLAGSSATQYSLDFLAYDDVSIQFTGGSNPHTENAWNFGNEAFPYNNKGAWLDETNWLQLYRWNVSGETSGSSQNRIARIHSVSDSYLKSQSWFFSHSMGSPDDSIIKSLPFTTITSPLDGSDDSENFRTVFYDNSPIAVGFNNNLLFTPTDLSGENSGYMFDIWSMRSCCIWNKNRVHYAFFTDDEKYLKVEKLTDYIFRVNSVGDETIGKVLVEDQNGVFSIEPAFSMLAMQVVPKCDNKVRWFKAGTDGESYVSNDVYYYGAGWNPNVAETEITTSFLFPPITIPLYVNTADTTRFNLVVLQQRNNILQRIWDNWATPGTLRVDEFYTHSQFSTDITYKKSYAVLKGASIKETFDSDLIDTSWWITGETVIYPIGILSKTYGENYITSTVDTGNNYVARFYVNNNKTFLSYDQKSQVYRGSEIFTIQSGNYYYDGQGIYYLGSQSDYTQNIFTAYALGMEFLANSSAEAYFYSKWDKCLYLFTASNTLQKSASFADCGNIIDAAYASHEQAFYCLFDDGTLYIKTQLDDCFIQDIEKPVSLQTTAIGCQVITEDGYQMYNPHLFDEISKLDIETEWIGNQDKLVVFSYVDFVFYSDDSAKTSVVVEVDTLNGAEVQTTPLNVEIKKQDWDNQLYRVRVVPKEPVGNAIKIRIKSESKVSLFALSTKMDEKSDVPSAPRKARL